MHVPRVDAESETGSEHFMSRRKHSPAFTGDSVAKRRGPWIEAGTLLCGLKMRDPKAGRRVAGANVRGGSRLGETALGEDCQGLDC